MPSEAVSRSIPACAGAPTVEIAQLRRYRVYPRVRGGTVPGLVVIYETVGLSPRARGHPIFMGHSSGIRRWSIPACAGAPSLHRWSANQLWVYPRVCGGTAHPDRMPAAISGLSPRVRGHPQGVYNEAMHLRSIPACAGAPAYAACFNPLAWVYPRVCGGTRSPALRLAGCQGLSPRVRGHLVLSIALPAPYRSIPACAGAPLQFDLKPVKVQVYPRVCGGTSK